MSSDLWSAFAGKAEDLVDNPWAEPLRTPDGQQEAQHGLNVLNPKPETLESTTFTAPAQLPFASTVSSTRSVTLRKDSDPWQTYQNDNENIWTDTTSSKTTIEPWNHPKAIMNYDVYPSQPLQDALPDEMRIQDDDFGEFEEPSDHGQAISDVERIAGTSSVLSSPAVNQQHRRAQSQHEPDPYADLGLLGKPATAAELPSQELGAKLTASWGEIISPEEQSGANLKLDVPYSADEWGDFPSDPGRTPEPGKGEFNDTISSTQRAPHPSQHSRSRSEPPSKPQIDDTSTTTEAIKVLSVLPPSNIPPPSILISLVAGLVQKLPEQIEKVMQRPAITSGSQKALEKALRGCLASLRVAARIVAGRKLRWRRDTHLSQSMRIGPAQAGKPGGMKLTGVDKAETQREDREAAEFVRGWKQNLGSIRASLASVNGQIAGSPLLLPDINEWMKIKTAKPAEGGITATRCCVLCGLKRDERIDKVDTEVWDTFGEWWTDSWGHVECRLFWRERERFLHKR